MRKAIALVFCGLAVGVPDIIADERRFGYSYEAEVLPKGAAEFEQWLTARVGKEHGRYAAWDFREELEFGLTERLTTALYLNFRDEFSSGVEEESETEGAEAEEAKDDDGGMDFKGISSEWKYQILSPYLHPVGVLAYLELTSDFAHETELEEKLIFSTHSDDWVAALNIAVEQEWEYEDDETVKEGVLEITAGISRKLNSKWSAGLEARNKREYEDNFEFKDEGHSAYFLGPNISYATAKWWSTLTVLPQIYSDSAAAEDHLDLEAFERVEIRLLAGVAL